VARSSRCARSPGPIAFCSCPRVLAKQQKIAHAFFKIQVVPQSIDTNEAYLANAGFKVRP
jgi:hypothetical protein